MTQREKNKLADMLAYKTKAYNQVKHNANLKILTTAYFHELNSIKNILCAVGGFKLLNEIRLLAETA